MTLDTSDKQRDQRGILVGRKRCTHEISLQKKSTASRRKEMDLVAPVWAGQWSARMSCTSGSLHSGLWNPLVTRGSFAGGSSQNSGWLFAADAPEGRAPLATSKAGFLCRVRIRFARATSSEAVIRKRPLTRYPPSSCGTTTSSCCRKYRTMSSIIAVGDASCSASKAFPVCARRLAISRALPILNP